MIDRNTIVEAAERAMEGTDIFLVDVIVNDDNEIEVEVDCMDRMSIDQCSELNRKIELALDRDREDFSLSVYSAGVGYPFKVFKQYVKAVGRPVLIIFPDKTKIEGELTMAQQTPDGVFVTVAYELKEKREGEKRAVSVEHEDRIKILPGMEVKEIITIK